VDGPKTKAEEYRQHAELAERQAKQTCNLEAKRVFEQLARYWWLMAEQAGQHRR
jgi:hypothetical protein